jgi:RND family efflux transporter MFP subunit
MKQLAILVTRCALVVGASFVLTGCSRPLAEEEAAGPPVVVVSRPIEREVTDYHDFTGRTAAVESVQVRARVWGYLRKINFREGAVVQKDNILFEIDPRNYQAELDRTQANFAQSRAHRDRLQADAARARVLFGQRAISREDLDKIVADAVEGEAAVRVAEASVVTAQLNVDDTKVRAPVSGRVSRTRVTIGNMVQSGENGGTMLTTLVSIDPVYAYFDVDDLTYLKIRHLTPTDGESSTEGAAQPVFLGLPNEPGFPHTGKIDFVDNQVEPGTGTMKMRGIFPNPQRLLTPGLFVRVRVPLGEPHRALLVTDRAIESDQGRKIVYVLNSDDTVEKRSVQLGKLHDGLRAIESGIAAGERMVIDGIHRVRPGLAVEPRLIAMPVPDASRNGHS